MALVGALISGISAWALSEISGNKKRSEQDARNERINQQLRREIGTLEKELASSRQDNAVMLENIKNLKNQTNALNELKKTADQNEQKLKAEFERKAKVQKEENDKKMNELKVNRI